MKLRLCYALIVLAFFSGTSWCPPQRTQPTRPNGVLGWKDFELNKVHFLGEFVLNKGESSDNRRIGVILADIIPPNPCGHPGTYHGSPKAVLKFFRPSDHRLLCEFTAVGDNEIVSL